MAAPKLRLTKKQLARLKKNPNKGSIAHLRASTKQAMTVIAKRVVARNLENKMIGWPVELNVNHNSAISSADCEPLVQQIGVIDSSVGNTAQQRMGDRVRPKSLSVRGVLSLKPQAANTSQPILVRVVIAAQKNIKVGSDVLGGSVDSARLLRSGFAGVGTDQVPFNGDTSDLNLSLNKELFRVYYDKVFQLGAGVSTGGTYPEAPMPDYCKRWSYRFKSLPANLTWDEGNGDWANNFAPFVAIGYAYSDGTAPDTVTTRVVSNITSFLEYEDA